MRIAGTVGDEPIDESYSEPFTLTMDATRITLPPELRLTEEKTPGDTTTETNKIIGIPVATARALGLAGTGVAALAAGLLASAVFLGLGRDEETKVRARHGSILIGVASAERQPGTQTIRVATMQDLVRLAQRDARTILRQELPDDTHLYFVQDGTVVYEYVVTAAERER